MAFWDFNILEGFVLAFLRTGTAIILLPVFGYRAVPLQIKAGLGFVIAIMVAPKVADATASILPGVAAFAAVAVAEVVVGLVFGLVTALILVGAEFAGAIIGVQMGFGMVNILDPQLGQQLTIIGRFQYMAAMLIFIALDAHLQYISILGESFTLIPLGGGIYNNLVALKYAHLTADVFVIAVKLAAPIMTILLLSEMAMGIIARTVPQMNVFIVGFPLKIGMGLLGLAVSWPLFVYVISKVFLHYRSELGRVLTMLGGG